MEKTIDFNMRYIGQQTHLLLPYTSSITLTQSLYDILFQYLITPEREEMLHMFIRKLETHIKTRKENPFSIPLSELEFLEEGLEELRLLNWIQTPVQIFKVELDDMEQFDEIIDLLNTLMVVNYDQNQNLIYVLPNNITKY